ncbi:NAD-dependent epimerase/dehydratase family protein [Salinicoccus sp. RF5]|uniref:NAD-dependent epimerase/dehydratase family protein n=1 Tax=Salinicoccus sp. RF5 TaxID=2748874 RepID=UPI001E2D98B5|nr:NAD-dependent epimerase/dehydratase family protein [Salinicoccus sp. RF5]MCC4722359.1 NAD-dependent epimerase/dehydratase family protein [Salinicoccus sp. RF5]
MKKILVTGTNSYIGKSLSSWLARYPDAYSVDTISLRDNAWKTRDFSKYDVIVHTVGIAHRKERKKNCKEYYKVNRDLSYQIAKKAKEESVKQFVFISSMSVYGLECGTIDRNTPLQPSGNYGKSKLQAEKLLLYLDEDSFKVVILRPPMIYGKGCKGNYPKLAKLATKTCIFPYINNQRSMLYIDNLTHYIQQIVDGKKRGIFMPQNTEYVNTSEMVQLIAQAHGKKIYLTKVFNPVLHFIKINTVKKLFGNLVYDKNISDSNYNFYAFKESILITEGGEKDEKSPLCSNRGKSPY